MRTTSDLMSYAEIYARENDNPFRIPDEFDLDFVPDTSFVDEVAELLNCRTAGGCECAGERVAPPTDGEEEKENSKKNETKTAVAPADNMGLVGYRFPRNWGGYDGGCEANFSGEWNDMYADLCRRLDVAKQAADDGNEADSYIQFGGFIWRVSAKGAGVGWAKYKWVMESHGVKLYIHSNPKGSIPPIRVRFGFECLVKTYLFKAVETLKEALLIGGFRVKDETISRVDMQVLLPVDVSDFFRAMSGERIITRCRGVFQTNSNLKTRRMETITIRSKNAELCIYDKRAEIEQKADSVYYQTFSKYVLGEVMAELPEKLTRVEFRFRTDFLRRYGVRTFEDLENSAWALLDIASSDWFRILSRDKVRGSENEIPDHELWATVRKAFWYYFAVTKKETRTKQELKDFKSIKEPMSVSRLVSQGLGCISSAAAVALETVRDIEPVKEYVKNLLDKFSESILEKISLKQIKNEITRGFNVENLPFYDGLRTIQETLSPVGEVAFLQYEGNGWEGYNYDDSDAF